MRDKKRTPYVKANGYSTDHLIQGMSDRELLRHMAVPDKFIRYAVATANEPMDERIEFWLENLPYIFRPQDEKNDENPDLYGVGLIFYGPGGTRKTTTAAALLLRIIRMGIKNSDPSLRNFTWHGWCMGYFADWQSVSKDVRLAAGDDEAARERSKDADRRMRAASHPDVSGDFLVLDDISRERNTEFNSGELQRLLRDRNVRGYPTIITTNHPPSTWGRVYGEVLAAFMERSFLTIEFEQ
jgi:hypothetical protein